VAFLGVGWSRVLLPGLRKSGLCRYGQRNFRNVVTENEGAKKLNEREVYIYEI
jgi:hypothetical protein